MEWDFFKKKKVQSEEVVKDEKVLEEPETCEDVITEEEENVSDDSDALKAEIEQLKQEIKQKNRDLDELNNLLKQSAAKENDKKESSSDDALQKIQDVLAEIKNDLFSGNSELIALLDKAENRLQRRDAEVQSFQEDYYRKTITPYIRQFIALGDMMRKVVDEAPEETKGQYIEAQFGKIVESIDYILRDFSFAAYQEGEYGSDYNPQKQDVVAYKETDKIELDKKVSRSLNPGYVWTLPYIIKAKANGESLPLKSYEFIFRKEQVETFKLK